MHGLINFPFLTISVDQTVIANNVGLKAPIHQGIKDFLCFFHLTSQTISIHQCIVRDNVRNFTSFNHNF
ncbi:hypothetical protein LguiA_030533 [Lonicera macranthoides]